MIEIMNEDDKICGDFIAQFDDDEFSSVLEFQKRFGISLIEAMEFKKLEELKRQTYAMEQFFSLMAKRSRILMKEFYGLKDDEE